MNIKRLNTIWEKIPSEMYGPYDVELPSFMFIAMLSFLIPMPLSLVYSEASSFWMGGLLVLMWFSVFSIKSVQNKMSQTTQMHSNTDNISKSAD